MQRRISTQKLARSFRSSRKSIMTADKVSSRLRDGMSQTIKKRQIGTPSESSIESYENEEEFYASHKRMGR